MTFMKTKWFLKEFLRFQRNCTVGLTNPPLKTLISNQLMLLSIWPSLLSGSALINIAFAVYSLHRWPCSWGRNETGSAEMFETWQLWKDIPVFNLTEWQDGIKERGEGRPEPVRLRLEGKWRDAVETDGYKERSLLFITQRTRWSSNAILKHSKNSLWLWCHIKSLFSIFKPSSPTQALWFYSCWS